ncbi:MAG TPA: hypothetical protein VEJ63_04145 [Planctomycetota bacterium]|nr:hypothetical protein [Planctomycetota bacterium]
MNARTAETAARLETARLEAEAAKERRHVEELARAAEAAEREAQRARAESERREKEGAQRRLEEEAETARLEGERLKKEAWERNQALLKAQQDKERAEADAASATIKAKEEEERRAKEDRERKLAIEIAPTYVTRDGRNIKALKVEKNGDFYAITDANNKTVWILREDVVEIVGSRTNISDAAAATPASTPAAPKREDPFERERHAVTVTARARADAERQLAKCESAVRVYENQMQTARDARNKLNAMQPQPANFSELSNRYESEYQSAERKRGDARQAIFDARQLLQQALREEEQAKRTLEEAQKQK